jgi:DNA modification methylase
VEVFAEVRRCLHPTGTIAVNYGDCYTSGGGAGKQGQNGQRASRTFTAEGLGKRLPDGLPPKNLLGMPFRLALALQADGWIWRSCMPWIKRSSMPESCTDRPSSAVEYVMLFSKGPRYYWDAEAVRRSYAPSTMPQVGTEYGGLALKDYASARAQDPSETKRRVIESLERNGGRNMRNSDPYFDSLDLLIEEQRAYLAHLEHLREKGGLLLSEAGEPLALDVNPEASKLQHFAAFARKLVTPLIQAATSERGCCSECGAPWVRVTQKGEPVKQHWAPGTQTKIHKAQGPHGSTSVMNTGYVTPRQTLGWRKSCQCETDATQPCVVLDPFAGTGTVGLAATALGRRAVLIDLKGEYLAMSRHRNSQVSLLL